MSEYIDLDTPLEVYVERGGLCTQQITTLRELLDTNKIPYTAADVRPVRFGKLEKYGAAIRCSVCGFDTQSWDVNFCPNCGADMREES